MEHNQICIPFAIKVGETEVNYEAVGFLMDGETSCLGSEALRRVDNGRIVCSKEEGNLLYQNKLTEELHDRRIVTGVQWSEGGVVTPLVSAITWQSFGGRSHSWLNLDCLWGRECLIVRRRD